MRYSTGTGWYSALLIALHCTLCVSLEIFEPCQLENCSIKFNNKINNFDIWGPDWYFEFHFRMPNISAPDLTKWKDQKCHNGTDKNATCPKGWWNVFRLTKNNIDLDREPGVYLHHTNAGTWLMRFDVTEPHLNATQDHQSCDILNITANHTYRVEMGQLLSQKQPGINKTVSNISFIVNGAEACGHKKPNYTSLFVARSNMDLWMSGPWHYSAQDLITVDHFKVIPTKDYYAQTGFDCYLEKDLTVGVNSTNGTIITYAEPCSVDAYGMISKDGKFNARHGGKYYFSFTGYIRTNGSEYLLEMVMEDRANVTITGKVTPGKIVVIATTGINDYKDWAQQPSTPAPVTTKAPGNATKMVRGAQRDSMGGWQEVKTKTMNAVVELHVNDQVYVRVANQSKPGSYLLAHKKQTHFVGIRV